MLRVVEHAAFSDTGRQRRANEDSMLARSPLFAVADGMGGAKAGEIASRTAIDVLGLGVEHGVVRSRLAELVRRANRAVHEAQLADTELAGMGTTATIAYVGEEQVTVAHVGDSRAYLLRSGSLRRLTEDHSLVEEMLRSGRLTEEEAANHPQRSIITRALGPDPIIEVDVHEWKLEAGDVLLLCSDGLTGMISESEIAEILGGDDGLQAAGRGLIAAANAAGGRDNITVVLARIGDTDAPAAGAAEDDAPASRDAPTAEHPTLTAAEPATVAGAAAHQSGESDEGGVPTAPSAPAAAGGGAASDAQPQRRAITPSGTRRTKRLAALVATGLTIAMLALAGWIATRITYFIGTDQGFVAIYQGVPYELPLGIDLYRPVYRSGVPVLSLDPPRAERLLDHQLRTGEDAQDLIRAVERDELQ